MVVKIARLNNDHDLVLADNKLNIWLLCKHPNIIYLTDWFRDNILQYLLVEFAKSGSITDFMQVNFLEERL